MTDQTPVVKSVTSRGVGAAIEFEDGHRVVLIGYAHGWSSLIDGLKYFVLYMGDKPVVQYAGRLFRSRLSDKEHRFTQVADGYSPEIAAGYWEAAQKYLHEEYFEKPCVETRPGPQELFVPWVLCRLGESDLDSIRAGLAPFPVLSPRSACG